MKKKEVENLVLLSLLANHVFYAEKMCGHFSGYLFLQVHIVRGAIFGGNSMQIRVNLSSRQFFQHE
jgi:hypothetical protein